MKIIYYKQFRNHLKERIKPDPHLFDRFNERVRLFAQDPTDPVLEDHELARDKENYRAFSITSDIRVIYYKGKNFIYFTDIGTHKQVY